MSNVSLIDGHIDEPKKTVIKCLNDKCNYFRKFGECSSGCLKNGFKRVITNYDRIKNMSVDELAQFMNDCGHDFPPYCDYKDATRGLCDQNCLKCAKEWLESEVTE